MDADPLFQRLEHGALRLDFDMSTHWSRVRTIMARDKEMDLTDAAVVVMSERHTRCQVLDHRLRRFAAAVNGLRDFRPELASGPGQGRGTPAESARNETR